MSDWNAVGAIAPTQLTDARLEAHHAAQWLARAARAYCAPVSDDSHTSLTWDSAACALITQSILTDLKLGVRLHDLTLLIQTGKDQKEFTLVGRSDSDTGDWLKTTLSEHELDPKRLDAPGPYALPRHALNDGKPYGLPNNQAFEELARYYSNAAVLLETVRHTQSNSSPVRCWPHHFDIATLISLDPDGGEAARSIGVGLSPGDDTYSEPYFYISPWPYPTTSNLPDLTAPAFWHREGYTAAILSSKDVVRVKDPAQQSDLVASVLRNAIKIVRKLLDG